MALQQDPRKRAPRYTETYSKRNYQPSKKPLVLITAGIVACTVAVAVVAVSCQGGFDMGDPSNPSTSINEPSTGNGDTPSAGENTNTPDSGKTDANKKTGDGDAGDNQSGKSDAGNTDANGAGNNANGSNGTTASNKYVPGQSINVPRSTTTGGSNGSAFNKPTVTISFSPSRERNSLENYYKRVDGKEDQLSDFCDDVFNEHLGSSYSTLVKDYDKYEKLRKKILKGIIDEDGDWVIYTYYGDKYLDAKVSMAKASKMLKERLDMLDDAYQAMFALGKNASSSEYTKAANKKLKNYADVTKKERSLMKSAKESMGL